jgi:hypothetical protein
MTRARWVLFGLLIGCHPPATGARTEEAACRRKCAADGLSMAGMVPMGERAASCVCEAPHTADPPASALTTRMPAGSTGTVGGAISDSHYQTQPQASPSGTLPH